VEMKGQKPYRSEDVLKFVDLDRLLNKRGWFEGCQEEYPGCEEDGFGLRAGLEIDQRRRM